MFIGGLTFFFIGLKNVGKGLELVAGDRLRATLGRVAGNRFMAFFFGILVTFFLQSSGATSAILVSFANSGIVTLFQATAVLLGADIGTAFVVILLSIKSISNVALIIVAMGYLMQILPGRRRMMDVGSIILGFGLLFYGMHLMTQAATPLKDSEVAMRIFAFLADNPFASLLMATGLSALVHSAGAIGIAIALSFAGAISFQAAIPIVMGANVGTCVTAILASANKKGEGRRVALAHTLSKIIGVAIVFPFIPEVVKGVDGLDHIAHAFITGAEVNVAAKIAISHILFNVGLGVIFLPLLDPLLKVVCWLMPVPPPKKKEFGPKYLDKSALETPALAFAQAKREILRIGATAQWLFSDCLKMFSKGELANDEVERIKNEDDRIDVLEKAVRFYLAEISRERLSSEQAKTQLALLSIAADLEDIGDTMSRELTHLAIKKAKWSRIFSDEGWHDLRTFQSMVLENFGLMMSMLTQPSVEIAGKIERHEEHMNEVEQSLRQAHITRLNQGLKESFDTSSVHLDILTNLRRINSKLTHITKLAKGI